MENKTPRGQINRTGMGINTKKTKTGAKTSGNGQNQNRRENDETKIWEII